MIFIAWEGVFFSVHCLDTLSSLVWSELFYQGPLQQMFWVELVAVVYMLLQNACFVSNQPWTIAKDAVDTRGLRTISMPFSSVAWSDFQGRLKIITTPLTCPHIGRYMYVVMPTTDWFIHVCSGISGSASMSLQVWQCMQYRMPATVVQCCWKCMLSMHRVHVYVLWTSSFDPLHVNPKGGEFYCLRGCNFQLI